jgi:pyridoxamine 5'-phosphate oxidase
MDIASIRRDYQRAVLDESHVDRDPIVQFRRWMDEALRSEVDEPTAMALATASADGAPSVRMVLLKGIDERGFSFFTDYRSRKGRELEANPRAEFCIHWKELERQIRVFGAVERLSVIESARYFASRPLESCLGAWASLQSSVLGHRKELEERLEETRQRFGDKIPHPPHWGGFRVIPQRIEFWQGRPSRLHDRLCFRKASTGWEIVRLSP